MIRRPFLYRLVVLAAVVLYMGTAAWVLLPAHGGTRQSQAPEAPAPAAQKVSLEGLPYRGVAIQVQRVDWMDRYEKSIEQIAELGADTVSLVIDTRQENGSSNRIYLDMRMTPTREQLAQLIKVARKNKLRVMLMPIVLLDKPRGSEWRGSLKPESWDDWFDSYREMMHHFAVFAQENKVDILVVGSELVTSENKLDQWTRTIRDIRRNFSGKLTYSSNWDHYTAVPFWNQLDLIGMNSYWKLGDDREVTLDQIIANWKSIQTDLLAFQQKMNKPILFTEVGWCSLSNAAHEPWDYTKLTEDIDLDLQKRLYEGFFRAWNGNPALGGFMIWEWPPDQNGEANRGYTPRGKPAEQVLRQWFSRPRWDVQ